ncbi:MAG TPA: hypothetical protein VM938_10435, partial [Acidimicrobiales bacterium]|nr:hypothetical protein [Acidimicrobiales bacterium]
MHDPRFDISRRIQLKPQQRRTPGSRRSVRVGRIVVVVAVLYALVGASHGAQADEQRRPKAFKEVAQLQLPADAEIDAAAVTRSGWLILNPESRRGYQVLEGFSTTVIRSFDLDTLKPLRRVVLDGVPITSGVAAVSAPTGTLMAGEIVHAVDGPGRRIYLAMSDPGQNPAGTFVGGAGFPPDGQRPLRRFVAIDEDRLDDGKDDFAASFREPVDQVRLHSYFMLGLKVDRAHAKPAEPGRLLALFAMPQGPTHVSPFYDHTLAGWDVSGLNFDAGAPSAGEVPPGTTPVTGNAWARRLDVCSGAPMASTGGFGQGNYQWGMLATRDAVYTACQASDAAGGVARIGVDSSTGVPRAVGGQEFFPLGQRISDVFVDDGGERVLVQSWGGGHSWWVFDTGLGRFTGAVSARATDSYTMSAGIDATTGRLYQLVQDYVGV